MAGESAEPTATADTIRLVDALAQINLHVQLNPFHGIALAACPEHGIHGFVCIGCEFRLGAFDDEDEVT